MRFGVIWSRSQGANYRALQPMQAMERRGHEVIWPSSPDGRADLGRLARCDVVHVYRRSDRETRWVLDELAKAGVGITWDNDEDPRDIPRVRRNGKPVSGLAGLRVFTGQMRVAALASVVCAPSRVLAERYRRAGIRRVEVIENYLPRDALRSRRARRGAVIGWVASRRHELDVGQIRIADALSEVVARHRGVRVECVGVDLALGEHYRHTPFVPFRELPKAIGGFDIGIAPLADTPLNRARSDVKLREYAACEVPWLASPVGPYLERGEPQGGRLVRDDGWFEALAAFVNRRGERLWLARRAKAWAESQTIDAAAGRWERLFAEAAEGQPVIA